MIQEKAASGLNGFGAGRVLKKGETWVSVNAQCTGFSVDLQGLI